MYPSSPLRHTSAIDGWRRFGEPRFRNYHYLALAQGVVGVLAGFDEWPDGITLQILSVFPGFVLQQIQNCLAVRQVVTKGKDRSELHWVYLGFEDDTPEQLRMRLKQCNLVGPAGFISMEDGAVGGFVQRGIAGARDQPAVFASKYARSM